MTLYDTAVETLAGERSTLGEVSGGGATLVVNVASRCGLTPQYAQLEELHERFKDRGFSVVGVPSNQFLGQEPGTAEEIQLFCSSTYGVTFPLLAKTDVNGEARHALYAALTTVADASGEAGDVQWNFEKFLLSPQGEVVARFRPLTEPLDPAVVSAVEAVLPS